MAYVQKDRYLVERHVSSRISWLLSLKEHDLTRYKATLAHLRGAASLDPGVSSHVWNIVFSGMPQSLCGVGSEPATEGEWASHLALTLFAVHQQSKDTNMHRQGNKPDERFGLGDAVSRLAYLMRAEDRGEQLEQGEMPRRFAALVMAESIEEVGHYLRQIVHQLRDSEIPLDYALLAGQLYDWQIPYRRDRVRLEWGREFASRPNETKGEASVAPAENMA